MKIEIDTAEIREYGHWYRRYRRDGYGAVKAHKKARAMMEVRGHMLDYLERYGDTEINRITRRY